MTLSVAEALRARHSVRSYRPDRVDPQVLRHILEDAGHTPSAKNTQPWQSWLVTGKPLKKLQQSCADSLAKGQALPMGSKGESEGCRQRGRQLWSDIAPVVQQSNWSSKEIMIRSVALFHAPAAFIFGIHKNDLPHHLVDLGLYIQSLCLSAASRSVDSCVIGFIRMVEPVIRRELSIPDDIEIPLALSMGYADDCPINKFRSQRAPLEETVHFVE